MRPQEFAEAAGIPRETLRKFITYHGLIEKWQKRINLVGAATLPSIWERHFLDSAQLFPFLDDDNKVVIDLGSGAGFPGLVLALLAESTRRATVFHLVESDARKAAFLAEAVRALALGERVRIRIARAETLADGELAGAADVVTARALAPLERLCALVAPLLAEGGHAIVPKGARHGEELAAAREAGWRFTLETHPSRTESGAAILVLARLARDSGGAI